MAHIYITVTFADGELAIGTSFAANGFVVASFDWEGSGASRIPDHFTRAQPAYVKTMLEALFEGATVDVRIDGEWTPTDDLALSDDELEKDDL